MSSADPTRLLLVGGSSEIALAIAKRLAAEGPVHPFLLGRDRARLEAALEELVAAGCLEGQVDLVDAEAPAAHGEAIDTAFEQAGEFDVVVLAVGLLGGLAGLDAPVDRAVEVMQVNFVGAGSLLLHCLRRLRDQRRGTLIVLSSVAGERVRSANAIYGAAKAGLDGLAQGLGDAIAGSGVRVLIVRPGFVESKMTAGLPRPPLTTTPDVVADATARALRGRAGVVWVPAPLRWVMLIARHLPRALWRRVRS
jgi:decaprenylphospho-beta-D-erythro-pentofuranosid-2-ulose 2-reductase